MYTSTTQNSHSIMATYTLFKFRGIRRKELNFLIVVQGIVEENTVTRRKEKMGIICAICWDVSYPQTNSELRLVSITANDILVGNIILEPVCFSCTYTLLIAVKETRRTWQESDVEEKVDSSYSNYTECK